MNSARSLRGSHLGQKPSKTTGMDGGKTGYQEINHFHAANVFDKENNHVIGSDR